MEKLTYPQAYSKIIDAYFKDEIEPMNTDFCFCGTLAGGCHWGGDAGTKYVAKEHNYSLPEYGRMEFALLSNLKSLGVERSGNSCGDWNGVPDQNADNYEDLLFSGMTAALEVLKQIHRDRGEDVDEVPGLRKRDLARTV